MSEEQYQIILADDHPMFRSGLKRMIEDAAELAVVGEAGDGLQLLELLKETKPDMVILDISMPKLRGIEAAREIKNRHPDVKVLFLTMHRNQDYFLEALAAKADGYLLKEDSHKQLIQAIETIRDKKRFLSPRITEDLSQHLPELIAGSKSSNNQKLSTREKEVLTLLAEGKSSKQIADLLYISLRTVDHHRASLKKKLKVENIVDLVKYAIRNGYTS